MVDDTPLLSASDDEPKGHRCGGFCCDSKRGTIIVNIITFVLTALSMIALAVFYNDPTWEQKVANQESIDYINKNYVPDDHEWCHLSDQSRSNLWCIDLQHLPCWVRSTLDPR